MISDFILLITLSRLFDAAFPVVSLFVGAAAVHQLHNPSLYVLIVVVVLLNSVAMIWNDIEDRRVDADNGRPRLAQSNTALLRRLKGYTLVLAGIGLLLASFVSIAAFVLATATLGVIWVYNSKPFQASRRPIMSVVVLSGAGALLPYLFGLSLGQVAAYPLVAGVAWWAGRMSLSVLKDYKDARGDARHEKKTFLLRYGAKNVALISTITLIIGYGVFILLMCLETNRIATAPLLILGIGIFVALRRPLFDSKASYAQLDRAFRTIAQYQLLLDAGVALWLI